MQHQCHHDPKQLHRNNEFLKRRHNLGSIKEKQKEGGGGGVVVLEHFAVKMKALSCQHCSKPGAAQRCSAMHAGRKLLFTFPWRSSYPCHTQSQQFHWDKSKLWIKIN